jgi:hypothetical protein
LRFARYSLEDPLNHSDVISEEEKTAAFVGTGASDPVFGSLSGFLHLSVVYFSMLTYS